MDLHRPLLLVITLVLIWDMPLLAIFGCGVNKDFRRVDELLADVNVSALTTAFFQHQHCSEEPNITDLLHCYGHCNTVLYACVGFAQIGSHCYICDHQTSGNGALVPEDLQTRFLLWTSYLLTFTDDRDECMSSPCVYGNCSDAVNGFNCTCDPGFHGETCDENIDECLSWPCEYGTCYDGVDHFNCSCYAGYQGELCDEDIDECLSSPCVHGDCQDYVNGFSCACEAGYDGDLCDEELDECLSSPCVHGACSDYVNGYTCSCQTGYQGLHCNDVIDNCETTPCVFGTCQNAVNSFICVCNTGYEGQLCDAAIPLSCDSPPPRPSVSVEEFGDCDDCVDISVENRSGDDADLMHWPSSGSAEVIQQLSDRGEWTNQDLEAGSRLYARVKDSSHEYLGIRMDGIEACFIDLHDGNNEFEIIAV